MSPAASTKRASSVVNTQAVKPRDPFADPNATFVPRGEGFLAKVEPGALGSMAVLLMLVGAIGYGGWSVLQEIQKVQLAPVDAAPGVASDIAPSLGGETIMAALDESVSVETPSVEALDRLYRPQALDVPVMVPRDGPIATLDPRSVGSLVDEDRQNRLDNLSTDIATAALESIGETVQVVEEAAPELALVAVRPSWVRVQAADGSVLFEKILDAGERYVVPAMELPPVLRTGNAGGIFFSVNGDAFGPVGKSGAVVKNVALADAQIAEAYESVDLAVNVPICEMFQVASTADLSCN
ncbi:DUF4115 domain-containing protein [Celeribacter arenosi]